MDAADVISSATGPNPTQEKTRLPVLSVRPPPRSASTSSTTTGGSIEYPTGSSTCPVNRPRARRPGLPRPGPVDPIRCWPSSRPPILRPASPMPTTSAGISDTYARTRTSSSGHARRLTSKQKPTRTPTDLRRPLRSWRNAWDRRPRGLTEREIAPGALDVANPYGTDDPQVFVPGNHSGFADLAPGTPATVDPPDKDAGNPGAAGWVPGRRHLRVRGDRPVQWSRLTASPTSRRPM